MKTLMPMSALLALCACNLFTEPSAPPRAEVLSLAAEAVVDTGSVAPEALEADTPWVASADPGVPEGSPTASLDPAQPAPASTWSVRRGESLAHFARWSELPVEAIAEASGLDLSEALNVGDIVTVPGDPELRAKVEVARAAHHRRRAEGYLASRGGAQGTAFHTVRTGESAWSVAVDELGVPVWLLEVFNPSADLDRLRPGEQLLYPVLADTVVDASADEAGDGPTPGSSGAP